MKKIFGMLLVASYPANNNSFRVLTIKLIHF